VSPAGWRGDKQCFFGQAVVLKPPRMADRMTCKKRGGGTGARGSFRYRRTAPVSTQARSNLIGIPFFSRSDAVQLPSVGGAAPARIESFDHSL